MCFRIPAGQFETLFIDVAPMRKNSSNLVRKIKGSFFCSIIFALCVKIVTLNQQFEFLLFYPVKALSPADDWCQQIDFTQPFSV